MFVKIATDGSLSLKDCDNFRAFSIQPAVAGIERQALAQIGAEAGDGHYWLDAEAVLALAERRRDPAWSEAYWNMLKSVAAYGYYDESTNRVKAHVETGDDQD